MTRRLLIITVAFMISSCGTKQDIRCADSSTLFEDFIKPEGITFDVNDVELVDTLLKTDTAKQVFENKIGKEILFFPEEHINYALVNCPNNGLIQTLQECFDNHRPLVLTPDIIWLAICQGVSIHINEQYDSLKSIIFIENKPDKIAIRNDSLEYSAKHWKSLVASFSEETKKYTKDDFYSFFVSEFSTTTPIIKTAYQITLLESYKKAFEYIGDTGCGIPSILIAGNKNDWQQILEKLDLLDKIGLTNWASNLKPIIGEFISASNGDIHKVFWQNIYKNASEYNAFYISGWIIKFFPYTKELGSDGVFDEKRGETKVGEIFKPNAFLDGNKYLLSTLSTDNFPSGVAKINITWNNHFKGITKKIEVYAGFFAIKQYKDRSLEPFISWAICEENAKTASHKMARNRNRDLKHNDDYWSPHIVSNITDSAIYDIKQFKNHAQSIAFIRAMLIDSLENNTAFRITDYERDTIKIVVLSNGTLGEISLTNAPENQQLTKYIKRLLYYLPEKWFPALTHPSEALEWDYSEEINKLKIRTNSIVKIEL